jgi:hypothetical protein
MYVPLIGWMSTEQASDVCAVDWLDVNRTGK